MVRSFFAFSPDKKLLAEVRYGCISLYNSCSFERLFGPVKVKELAYVQRLAFSCCGNFVFFGKFDRAFSVERGIIETYFPLQTVHLSFGWCSFTLDRQHIVVKCNRSLTPKCWLCLLNHLCLWAKLEIARSRERDPLCRCFPHKLEVTRKHPQLAAYQGSRITAMRPLSNLLSQMKREEWCSLLEKVQLNRGDGTFLVPNCESCKTAEGYEALTLEEVRQFVIDHYSEIFKYQVLDLRTGKPVLDLALSGVKVSPFIHFCHLGTAFEICGALFTGIGKALSLANIALLSTICHHLLFRSSILPKPYFSLSSFLPTPFKWCRPGPVDESSVFRQNLNCFIEEIKRYAPVEDDVVLYETHEFRLCALCLQTGTTTVLYSSHPYMMELDLEEVPVKPYTLVLPDDDIIGVARKKALALSTYTFTNSCNEDTCEPIEEASVLSTVSSTIASELGNLPDEFKKVFFPDSIPCFSPGGVWVAKPAGYFEETTVLLFRGRHHNKQQHSNNLEYVLRWVAQFCFTNDHSFFPYLSVFNTLHALSLQSGTILQSISGVSPLSFIAEGQVVIFWPMTRVKPSF